MLAGREHGRASPLGDIGRRCALKVTLASLMSASKLATLSQKWLVTPNQSRHLTKPSDGVM
jgi:hypothetical protein